MSEDNSGSNAFCMRARDLVAQGRAEDALALYDDVLKADPCYALAYADRGTTHALLGKYDLALRDMERAFSLGFAAATAYCTMGNIYSELRQFHNALECYSKAIALDASYGITYLSRSDVLHELGDDRAAVADLEKCLELITDEGLRKEIARRMDLLRYRQ
jgi:tetratricopeptide (TPR) repeat protein